MRSERFWRVAVSSGGMPADALSLYLLNAAAFLVLIALYALVAPGAPRSGLSMWLVFGLGELYILARHYLKLLFYASETVLFQGALAHAAYTAAPALVWPDSPAAETIGNADPTAMTLTARLFHELSHLQERANSDCRRRADQRRPAAASARTRGIQPYREHERFPRSGRSVCEVPARPDPARPAHASPRRARGDGRTQSDRGGQLPPDPDADWRRHARRRNGRRCPAAPRTF